MIRRYVLGFSLLLSLSACTQPAKVSSVQPFDGRQPAQADLDNEVDVDEARLLQRRERQYEYIMNDPLPGVALKNSFLTRLIRINYRIEGEVAEYERELESAIQQREANADSDYSPTDVARNGRPTKYALILALRRLQDRQAETIVYIYERLLQTMRDQTASQADRARAERIIDQINSELARLEEVDRDQIAPLIEHLDEALNQRAYEARNGQPKSDRMPASVVKSAKKLQKVAKRYKGYNLTKAFAVHRKKTAQRAKVEMSKTDIFDPSTVTVPKQDNREPAGQRFEPGTGTYGNIIGKSLAPNTWVMTLDDGPNSASTVAMLRLLKGHRDPVNANGAPASLFWLTKDIVRLPSSVALAKELGFPINSHSRSHKNLPTLGSAGLTSEIEDAVAEAQRAVGVQPATGSQTFRFFRCPYGACFAPANAGIRSRIANLNMIHAYWTVDSLDWKFTKQPARTAELTIKGMAAAGRGIVLMHDIHQGTVEAMRLVLADIKRKNESGKRLRLLTLEAAVDEYNAAQ